MVAYPKTAQKRRFSGRDRRAALPMSRTRIPVGLVNQICVESQTTGLCAVYMVETRNDLEAENLSRMFEDFAPAVQSVQLSSGKLVSYAVQLAGDDQALLEQIEAFLKKNFEFVVLHRSFDPLIYDVVRELCKDSGSTLLPMPKCDICGKRDPFPRTVVRLLDKGDVNLATRVYCSTCTAESARNNNREFVVTLLRSDRSGLGAFGQMNLVRSRSRKRMAFRIKADAAQQFALR